MKKFGMFLMLLSLVTFNIGCGDKPAEEGADAPATEGDTEVVEETTETETDAPAE